MAPIKASEWRDLIEAVLCYENQNVAYDITVVPHDQEVVMQVRELGTGMAESRVIPLEELEAAESSFPVDEDRQIRKVIEVSRKYYRDCVEGLEGRHPSRGEEASSED